MIEDPLNLLKNGIFFHTIVADGKMFHVNPACMLMVKVSTGDVSEFSWDELTGGLAEVLDEQTKEREIIAKVLSKNKKAEIIESNDATEKQDPLTDGLFYYTIVATGKMFHVNPLCLLVVVVSSGEVSEFSWDDVTTACNKIIAYREREEEMRKKLLDQQRTEEGKKPGVKLSVASKLEGFKAKKSEELPKSSLSAKARKVKSGK